MDGGNQFDAGSRDQLPREMMDRLSDVRDMPDDALLAILLKTGAHGCDVRELARRLIALFGSLGALVETDWRTIRRRIRDHNRDRSKPPILGIGDVKIKELGAAFEIARRSRHLRQGDFAAVRLGTNSASAAYRLFAPLAIADEQENFYALPVDSARRPMSDPIRLLRGTADRSPEVYARDVFREAIRWGARYLFVAHNHPCGDAEPSRDDLELTTHLVNAGRFCGIDLVDHLVLGDAAANGGRGYVSIRARHPDLFA